MKARGQAFVTRNGLTPVRSKSLDQLSCLKKHQPKSLKKTGQFRGTQEFFYWSQSKV